MEPSPFDLVLTGGRVLDPGCGVDGVADVGVRGDRIAAVGPDLARGPTTEVVDVSGTLVLPGLVDLHTHVYEYAADFALNADRVGVDAGVTTVVDMGCTGAWCFPGLRAHVMDVATTDVVAFLNIMLIGSVQGTRGGPALFSPDFADVDAMVAMHALHADKIRGIKTYAESGGVSQWGLRPLLLALEAAEQTGLPLYIHTGELLGVDESHRPDPHDILPAVLERARPGDLLGHSYSVMPDGVLGPDRVPTQALRDAVASGVLLDIGHGLNFEFDTARRMIDAGLLPAVVSSDVHGALRGVHVTEACTWSLVGTIDKLLALGVPLDTVIAGATVNPARVLRMDAEIGTLAVGSRADVTVLEAVAGAWTYADCSGAELTVDERWVPRLVVRAGARRAPSGGMLPDLLPPPRSGVTRAHPGVPH
jgi:dihydroorotase